ncbi:MAG: hypothetical protein LBD12_06770, partial [Clostridiales Family XIII bacterium]|nr:hypothetical protein [Clostridiales Family XIII bacterium]
WIASNGSNYFWIGEMTKVVEPPSKSKNGDTAICKTVYPMIKGYTDYTLGYKERTEDLSETIETFFAVK